MKGHASKAMVEKGQVTQSDKDGNDAADMIAKKGAETHGELVVEVAKRYAHRHYVKFASQVHDHIVEGNIIKNKLLEANKRKENPFPVAKKKKPDPP